MDTIMDLATLLTESRNPATEHIDQLPTLDMLRLINNEDAKVAQAVAADLPDIARAIDEIAQRVQDGGRVFYIGAGTSGRLGVLDASEIPRPSPSPQLSFKASSPAATPPSANPASNPKTPPNKVQPTSPPQASTARTPS